MTIEVNAIPAELRGLPQWVCWRFVQRPGSRKPTKVPMRATGGNASSTDPATWCSFGEALEASAGSDGIGFVFAPENGMVGIDLDDSLDENGLLLPWAKKIVEAFATYTEVSPSGKGVKLWARGKWPGKDTGGRRPWETGAVEMYGHGRFFTVTGVPYLGTPDTIAENQRCIDRLHKLIWCPDPKPSLPTPTARPRSGPIDRCFAYLERCPESVEGDRGHDKCLRAACECYRFGLSDADALAVMRWWSAHKSKPPWSDREIDHKLKSASAKIHAAGEFGMRLREAHAEPPPTRIAAPPTTPSSGLAAMIEDGIAGRRVNIDWPYHPGLTSAARCLLPGTITLLCGGGGSTKSLWLNQCCLGWLEADVPFAVFHLEEDRDFHLLRAIAQHDDNSNLTLDDWQRQNPEAARTAVAKHAHVMDALGACIWDAPESDVGLGDLILWIDERAREGRRIIAIDPVTAASSGREPWEADKRFILQAKRIMRRHGASLILVTHPRHSGGKDAGEHLDNIAGGKAYNRFTQTVIFMQAHDDQTVTTLNWTPMGTFRQQNTINRTAKILKARSGRGVGQGYGLAFDPTTFRFSERGVIAKDEE